ncbi:F-box domain-containing protein [Favolaschia claudopus]|uniref:F-box domain-containing protein n=1 Tax=Favolaschia claudopus TaxID=2862362 RepID=A0AAW0DW39_9AGAR
MQKNLEADRACVAEIDAEIAWHEQCIAELQSRRVIASQALDAYKYPVLKLPNEIVSEIFLHFLPPSTICPPLTGLHSPSLLTHICSKWRAIALSTPDLWTTVPVSKFREGRDHIASEWLTRSPSRLLTVRIHGLVEEDVSRGMYSAIMSHRARLEHLTIIVPGHNIDLLEGPMPLLRHLHLDLWQLSDSQLVVLDNAPLLCSVVLSHQAAYLVELPWLQLTSLTLQCQTPNLAQCELTLFVRGDDPLPPVRLPRLQSLLLRGYKEHGEDHLGEDPLDALSHFFSQSGCNLEELVLCIIRYDDELPRYSISGYWTRFPPISEILAQWQMRIDPCEDFHSESESESEDSDDSDY